MFGKLLKLHIVVLGLVAASLAYAQQSKNQQGALPELIAIDADTAATPNGALLLDRQQQFRNSLSSGETEDALESAKQIVSLASMIWGEKSEQVASSLTNLAITQTDNGNFDAARENFVVAIKILEEANNSIIDAGLINPIRGLADASMALDNAEQAVPLYERAIHVSHVNDGPNNLGQIQDMDALSRAYFALGELRDANKVQENMFRLQRRQFDKDSDQYIDAVVRRARWYTEVRSPDRARIAYTRAIQSISRIHGDTDKRLIQPLIELAFIPPTGFNDEDNVDQAAINNARKQAISRAVRIARLHATDDPALLAQTLVKKGDFHTSDGQGRLARLPYKQAWEITTTTPGLESLHKQLFSEPKAVRLEPIRATWKRLRGRAGTQSGVFQNDRGFVEVGFTVSPFGRPIALYVIDSQPAGLMDRKVLSGLRSFKYRPAFRDGNAVQTQGLTFRHDFRYSEERLTPKERERIAKVEAMRNGREESSDEPETAESPLEPDLQEDVALDAAESARAAPDDGDDVGLVTQNSDDDNPE
ncbi:MAG: tetratricopeptide repeat protein [Woeseiaceae bacterium]